MGNGVLAIGPKLPRPSSTLPLRRFAAPLHDARNGGQSRRSADGAGTAASGTFQPRRPGPETSAAGRADVPLNSRVLSDVV
jgi:hypothetical protein